MPYLGEAAALAAAAVWAVSIVLYRRLGAAIPPLALNLFKGMIAMPLLLAVVVATSPLEQAEAWSAPIDWWPWLLLAVSGAIGIGVGDTAFFGALNRLRERRTILLIETAAPPMAAGLAMLTLGDTLSWLAGVGAVVTLAGVAWVVVERSTDVPIKPGEFLPGLALGLLAAACQAAGLVMSKAALEQSEIGPVTSALVRIVAGVVVLLVWMPIARTPYVPPTLREWRPWRAIAVATFLGTFLGISLMQLSIKHTSAGITQTLIATSTLFVLPLLALSGERISSRAVLGAAVAIAGVALLVAGGG